MPDILGAVSSALGLGNNGELAKFTIEAWTEITRDDGRSIAKFEAFINPDEFTINYNVVQDNQHPLGAIGSVGTFLGVKPLELTVKLFLDGTNATGNKIDVPVKINEFYRCVGYSGGAHRTQYLRIKWGSLTLLRNEPDVLDCCLKSASIQYKMFSASGTPLRAIINATFIEVRDYVALARAAQNESADLTHVRVVKEGDTLPGLAYEIYGDVSYYLEVARVNQLTGFRDLKPGRKIIFPPLEKNGAKK